MDNIKILLFTSNPEGTSRLKLDEEVRSIKEKIRSSKYRDDLELISVWAVRPDDLLQELNTHKPAIVHFSGHGNQQGEIVLMDNNRQVKPVSAAALKMLFTTLRDNISVVVLNACYSQVQAAAISEVIECVIGMSVDIGDDAAVTFAASFYRAIGFGRSVQEAFEQGKTALMLEGLPEETTPQLLVRKGIDASKVILTAVTDSIQQEGSSHKIEHKLMEREQVQLILDGKFSEFDEKRQNELISVLAILLHIDGKSIRVLKVTQGSIILDLELAKFAVNRLIELINIRDSRIGNLGIVAVRRLHQLPQPPADFTGREGLIYELITDFEGATTIGQSIHGLTGMGGIGKTALGLVVAHKLVEYYPDAQIFLDLKGTTAPLSALDVMRHVILSFEPTTDVYMLDEASVFSAYQSALNGKRILLFLDNARSAEQIAPLRLSDNCALLITSRWIFSMPGFQSHHVPVMRPENAIEFLLELCPYLIGEQADRLANACGYLPLALRIAGSFLQVNDYSGIEKYLTQFKDRKSGFATFEQSHVDAELTTEPSLLETFELSYHQLSRQDQERWRLLGVFPALFDPLAASAMWNLQEDAATRLLNLLWRYSLLYYRAHDEASARYGLHDLLAGYALSQMTDEEEREARLQYASYYKKVLSAADNLYREGGDKILVGVRLFYRELTNLLTGLAWVTEQRNDSTISKLCIEYLNAGETLLSLGIFSRERIQWYEAAVLAARQISDKRSEGHALGRLGVAYAYLGETRKAIELHKQHLAIANEIGDFRGEGASLGNLGIAYYRLGEVHKAIKFYEQSLAIARETGDRRGEGNLLNSLGNAYKDLGKAREAIKFHEQSIVIVREIGDRRGEGNALNSLGNVYEDLGEPRKAIEFYEQALVIAREIGDYRGQGISLGNLGVAYKHFGETSKAIEFCEQYLNIVREIGDRRGEGTALGNLGVIYKDLGETHKAIEFYEHGLAIAREIGDLRGEGNALFNIGSALYDLEEKYRAFDLVKQALEIFEAIESPNAERTRYKLRQWKAGRQTDARGEAPGWVDFLRRIIQKLGGRGEPP